MIIKLKYADIEFKTGDLTQENADAVVNAANNSLLMGGGVAKAIREAAGRQVQEEASGKAPIAIGSAVETGAGYLNAKYIIHGAVMGLDFRTDAFRISETMNSVLDKADALGISTIAFPAFGTGVGRFPPEQAASAMLTVLKQRLESGRSGLSKITFVLWTDELRKVFEEEAARLFNERENEKGKG